jgi:hypothetical protein
MRCMISRSPAQDGCQLGGSAEYGSQPGGGSTSQQQAETAEW